MAAGDGLGYWGSNVLLMVLSEPYRGGVRVLKIKTLRKTVHTYEDWELKQLATLYRYSQALTKEHIVVNELGRRKVERDNGTYVDKTLNPKVSIQDRLSLE